MAVDDYLRVAWQADRDGRERLREAMVTLAIGESRPGDIWADLLRARLLLDRPGHFLGTQPTLLRALGDPRVQLAMDKLRKRNPMARVCWLRLRSEAAAGPYTGKPTPLKWLLADLLIGPSLAAA